MTLSTGALILALHRLHTKMLLKSLPSASGNFAIKNTSCIFEGKTQKSANLGFAGSSNKSLMKFLIFVVLP